MRIRRYTIYFHKNGCKRLHLLCYTYTMKRMDCFHFSFLFTNEHGGRKMVVNYHNEPGIDFTDGSNVEAFKEVLKS